jgi:hypothetical protein
MSVGQYGVWFMAVWLAVVTVSFFSVKRKFSRLQRNFDELSNGVKDLLMAEERRFLKEINTPKANEVKTPQIEDAPKSLAA